MTYICDPWDCFDPRRVASVELNLRRELREHTSRDGRKRDVIEHPTSSRLKPTPTDLDDAVYAQPGAASQPRVVTVQVANNQYVREGEKEQQ